MAIGEYRGVNNVVRKVTTESRGVDNVVRKITKQYRGVANVARQFFEHINWRGNRWTVASTIKIDDWAVSFADGVIEIYLKTTATSGGYNGTAAAQYKSDVPLDGKSLAITYSLESTNLSGCLGVIEYRTDWDDDNEIRRDYLYTYETTKTAIIPSGTNSIGIRIDHDEYGTYESTLIVTRLEIDGKSII